MCLRNIQCVYSVLRARVVAFLCKNDEGKWVEKQVEKGEVWKVATSLLHFHMKNIDKFSIFIFNNTTQGAFSQI